MEGAGGRPKKTNAGIRGAYVCRYITMLAKTMIFA